MNSIRQSVKVAQLARNINQLKAIRNKSSSDKGPLKEVPSGKFNKLKKTQKLFQVDDGKPVYLKAGSKDKLMFQVTIALLAIGFGLSVQVLVTLALPK